ncbi:hypothetical protein HDC92_004894 [Pedobacter sp. AK017]|uniref:MGH1-like glycoside hydrolase domain-containing protein n=1 Tax=Pedobacter sp. AK017 TaxID=2723073 RepID=UPI0016192F6E|nr:trehalase family glycosidase [Pedobacter sp. AK017]MBB5441187.1 hypothetical protein [Pedobacter sp. AK017]
MNISWSCILFISVLLLKLSNGLCQNKSKANEKVSIDISIRGFNKVEIQIKGKEKFRMIRQPVQGMRPEHGFTDKANVELQGFQSKAVTVIQDTLPVSLAEVVYRYVLINKVGDTLASVKTSRNKWPQELLPELILPGRLPWVKLYNKAWELNWHQIASSAALPARFSHNVTPDNGRSYLWDASFSILFQRYAAPSGADPAIATLDNFYGQQQPDGYILRYFTVKDYAAGHDTSKEKATIEAVNPPLLAWGEWNYFEISADYKRLEMVLPGLIKQYHFIESFLQKEPGKYIWDGNPSGWDNIRNKARHKFWVELPAMQALSARYISKIAAILHQPEIERKFTSEYEQKKSAMELYWNADKQWYCSIGDDGKFTQKTLSGMWPVLAGIVPRKNMPGIVANLLDVAKFSTSAMPLPTLAKDENGYNSKGEYWLGSVWINMSLITIRSLKANGYEKEAFDLAVKTLNGISRVYENWSPKPHTLWECYAPEFAAPASHKVKPDLGSVRSDFAGWTACLINLLIENVMGIEVSAVSNTISWNIALVEEHGIKKLRFGKVNTDLLKKGRLILVRSNYSYTLKITIRDQQKTFKVEPGNNRFEI